MLSRLSSEKDFTKDKAIEYLCDLLEYRDSLIKELTSKILPPEPILIDTDSLTDIKLTK